MENVLGEVQSLLQQKEVAVLEQASRDFRSGLIAGVKINGTEFHYNFAQQQVLHTEPEKIESTAFVHCCTLAVSENSYISNNF